MKIVRIYGCGGEGGQEKQGKRFTIITKPHKNRKGYIIMEIMSTNVTNTTRYRGEIHRNTTYFGGGSTISLHKISKEIRRKVA